MKEKKRKKLLKKLLNKVQKKIESTVSLGVPVNRAKLRMDLVSIVINFCRGLSNKSKVSIFSSSHSDFTDKIINRLKPLLDEEIRNKLNMGGCSICGRLLDDYKSFKRDFPEQFKICCLCKDVADYIYKWDHPINDNAYSKKGLEKYYERYQDKFDNLFIIQKKGE